MVFDNDTCNLSLDLRLLECGAKIAFGGTIIFPIMAIVSFPIHVCLACPMENASHGADIQ